MDPFVEAACVLDNNPCEERIALGGDNITGDGEGACGLADGATTGSDYQCVCDPGNFGAECDDTHPCVTHSNFDDFVEDVAVCNGGSGKNNDNGTSDPGETDDDYCQCDCSTHEDNEGDNPPNTVDGDYCNERICHANRNPPTCQNGGVATENLSEGSSGSAKCECVCATNYSGDLCEVDECGDACQNGGVMDRDTCTCSCPNTHTGDKCQDEVGEQPTGTGCWKCDAMTYAQCATEGTFQLCPPENVNSVCFVEYREQNQQLTQLCTGCKETEVRLRIDFYYIIPS